MKIGDRELGEADSIEANRIISEFFNQSCSIIIGDKPDDTGGRSFLEDKQYRLKIDNGHYVGIKREFDKGFRHENEFLVRDIRIHLNMPNYEIKQIKGFPMDGPKWRDDDCLLSDWGRIGQRISLKTLLPNSISQNKIVFLEELGRNSALSYALGLWDRSTSNFVWDEKEGKIFSIDHESLSSEDLDRQITAELSNVIMKFYDYDWYEDQNLKLTFESGFDAVWADIVKKRAEIVAVFEKYTVNKKQSFLNRISKSSGIPKSIIMSL